MAKAANGRANHACAERAGASGRFTLTLLDFAEDTLTFQA